jgi:3-isopropylmalate/(R)-2-methylmalate dehydratase small subunit
VSEGTILRGRAWLFGDHVDTDVIIPVRYCNMFRKEELGPYAMAGADPEFASRIAPGDFIVAGANFGCGSSRETAPLALLGARVGAVVAVSFGRIFFRNAVNVGLPIFESPEASAACRAGDQLAVDAARGLIRNETLGLSFAFAPYSAQVAEIIAAGGLVPYVRRRLGLSAKG